MVIRSKVKWKTSQKKNPIKYQDPYLVKHKKYYKTN